MVHIICIGYILLQCFFIGIWLWIWHIIVGLYCRKLINSNTFRVFKGWTSIFLGNFEWYVIGILWHIVAYYVLYGYGSKLMFYHLGGERICEHQLVFTRVWTEIELDRKLAEAGDTFCFSWCFLWFFTQSKCEKTWCSTMMCWMFLT